MSSPKPSNRPIICAGSGAASSATASTAHVPSVRGVDRASSTNAVTVPRTWSSQRPTARGVNRRDTTLRRSTWWGSSSPMIDRSAGMLGR